MTDEQELIYCLHNHDCANFGSYDSCVRYGNTRPICWGIELRSPRPMQNHRRAGGGMMAKPCVECGKGGVCYYSGLICEYLYDWNLALRECDGYDNGG